MEINRRDFIRCSFILSGSFLLSPISLHGFQREESWQPAYEKLEKRGELAERVDQVLLEGGADLRAWGRALNA